MFDWLSKFQVPASVAVAIIAATLSAYAWLHSEFVLAQEYQQFKQTLEVQGLQRDKRQAETEVLRLEVKQEAYPKKFDAVDKAMLKKQRADLVGVNADLKEVKTRSAK